MAEFLYYLTIFSIKAIILVLAILVIATSLIFSAPYVLFWRTPIGMTWWQAAGTRLGRVMKVIWGAVEVAFVAIDTPA